MGYGRCIVEGIIGLVTIGAFAAALVHDAKVMDGFVKQHYFIDVSADGRDDIVIYRNDKFYVSIQQEDGTYKPLEQLEQDKQDKIQKVLKDLSD